MDSDEAALTQANHETGLRGFLNRGGVWRLVLILVAYLAIYLGAGWFASLVSGHYTDDALLSSVGSVFFQVTLSLLIGAAVLLAFSRYMGWTSELFGRQPIYRSRWMWIAPIIVVLPIILRLFGIDWGLHGFDLVAFLLVTGLLIGFVEELLYRGVSVKMLRAGGHGEWVVAAVSSLFFALSHTTNLLGGQPISTVAPTIGYTFAFGVLMYLTMRVTGFLLAAIILHGLTDPTTILAVGDIDKVATGSSATGVLAIAGLATFLLIVSGYVLLIFIRGKVSPSAGQ